MDIDRMMDKTRKLIESNLMDVNESLFNKQNYLWDITVEENTFRTGIRNIVDAEVRSWATTITDQLMYEIYGID